MKPITIALLVFFLGAMVSLGVCADAAPGNSGATVDASATANADLVTFVDNAVAYAKANGKDKAIVEFNNNKSTEFIKDALYIFAVGSDGLTLAHPYRSDFVGKSQMDLLDTNGVAFFKNMATVAKTGKGFVYYVFANPAHDKKPELKLTYVEKVDDSWWLGSGTYLSDISATFSQASRDELTSFVEGAAKFAKDNGKDKALSAFNDKNGSFVKGGLYVFAYDFECNTLAAPTQPDLVGKNRIDAKDPNGVEMIKDMADLAKDGSGLTYYVYADPAKDMAQKLKLSYVMKVDDNWWLGAGLYAE
jgi:signal transduction histidine kinase